MKKIVFPALLGLTLPAVSWGYSFQFNLSLGGDPSFDTAEFAYLVVDTDGGGVSLADLVTPSSGITLDASTGLYCYDTTGDASLSGLTIDQATGDGGRVISVLESVAAPTGANVPISGSGGNAFWQTGASIVIDDNGLSTGNQITGLASGQNIHLIWADTSGNIYDYQSNAVNGGVGGQIGMETGGDGATSDIVHITPALGGATDTIPLADFTANQIGKPEAQQAVGDIDFDNAGPFVTGTFVQGDGTNIVGANIQRAEQFTEQTGNGDTYTFTYGADATVSGAGGTLPGNGSAAVGVGFAVGAAQAFGVGTYTTSITINDSDADVDLFESSIDIVDLGDASLVATGDVDADTLNFSVLQGSAMTSQFFDIYNWVMGLDLQLDNVTFGSGSLFSTDITTGAFGSLEGLAFSNWMLNFDATGLAVGTYTDTLTLDFSSLDSFDGTQLDVFGITSGVGTAIVTGNSIVLNLNAVVRTVPEPSRAMLLGLGLAGIVLRRQR